MILAFSTKINGKQTFFVEKIIKSIEEIQITERDKEMIIEAIEQGYLNVWKVDKVPPKLHTIREDKNNRWKAGVKIDFFINVRQKNMFRFAPVLTVLGIQKIEIVYYTDKEVLKNSLPPKKAVAIDGKRLNEIEILKLATNDGFDNVDDFFNYFNTDFEGKIIHWTDLKY